MRLSFTDLPLSQKLFAAPLVCTAFLVAASAISLWGIRVQKSAIVELYENRITMKDRVAGVESGLSGVHIGLYRAMSWSRAGYDAKKIEELGAKQLVTLATMGEELKRLAGAPGLASGEKKFSEQLATQLSAYRKDAADLLDMVQSDVNLATMYMGQADEKFEGLHKTAAEFLKLEESLSRGNYDSSLRSSAKTSIILGVVVIASCILALLVSLGVARLVMGPVRRMVEVIEAMTAGDLTRRAEAGGRDEIGRMAGAFNTFVENLHLTVTQLAGSASQLAASSEHLQQSSEQMASATEEVSAQVQSLSSAGEEMATTSQDIANNCHVAADQAKQASECASGGASVVKGTLVVMNRTVERVNEAARTIESLNSRGEQIAAIVGTIEDIADQTNLLALNAAIEAARAGEHGRGFAVVADEVRKLSERTTKATKEIGQTIQLVQQETSSAVASMVEGVREVSTGSAEAAKSGEALGEIIRRVDKVTDQVNQIAAAAEQQHITTGGISRNLSEVSSAVQVTSQGAHESAAAADELARLSLELNQFVGQFRLA